MPTLLNCRNGSTFLKSLVHLKFELQALNASLEYRVHFVPWRCKRLSGVKFQTGVFPSQAVRMHKQFQNPNFKPHYFTGCLPPKCPDLIHMIHAPVITLQMSVRVRIITFCVLTSNCICISGCLFACSRPNPNHKICSRPNPKHKMGFYEQILKDAGGKQQFIVCFPTLAHKSAKLTTCCPY